MLGQYDLAGAAAQQAIGIFSGTPALAIDVAWATLIRAMSLPNLGNTREALDLIIKTARLFGEHAEPRGYRVALAVCGNTLVDLEEYAAARDAYSVARTLAEEQNDPREVARMLRNHRELLLNWFDAKALSTGIVEGLNSIAKLTTKKAFGFRTYRCIEVALYHRLGALPDPVTIHRFCRGTLFAINRATY